MKSIVLIVLLALLMSNAYAAPDVHSFVPAKGFVPDEKTAVAIAMAVLRPIYGEENVLRQRPFSARLSDDQLTWIVQGSLSGHGPGGTARAEIAKDNGRIMRVTHSK